MLDSCPTSRRQRAGFTLLEILAVLFLMAMIGGLVAPRLVPTYQNLTIRADRDDILTTLGAMPAQAVAEGRQIVLSGDVASRLESTGNWQVVFPEPTVFLPNGFCTGGRFELQFKQRPATVYEMPAPYCRPVPVDEDS